VGLENGVLVFYGWGKFKAIASGGSALYEKALSGDIRAMWLYLKTHS